MYVCSTSGSKLAINLDYLEPLRDAIMIPLQKLGISGIQEAIKVMTAYNLTREDLTNLIELCRWKNPKKPFRDIDSKVICKVILLKILLQHLISIFIYFL